MCAVSLNLSRFRACIYQGLTKYSHPGIDQHPVESTDQHAEEARPCWHLLPDALHHLCLNRQGRHCHKRCADRFDVGSFLGWNRSQRR